MSLKLSLRAAKSRLSEPTVANAIDQGSEKKWKDLRGKTKMAEVLIGVLANRRLQPLGHLTAEEFLSINDIAGYAKAIVRVIVPEIVPASDQNRLRRAAKGRLKERLEKAAVFL